MIDFPASPTLNQVFSSGEKSWRWNGTQWVSNVTTSGVVTGIIAGSNVTITSTGPSGTGNVTINSTSTGSGPTGPIGPTGPAGSVGGVGPTGPAGAAGVRGPTGPAGANGLNGGQGPAGPTGPAGASGLGASSLASNGYQKFSNGLMIQWGTTSNTIGAGNTAHSASFPTSFTSVFSVVIGTYTSQGTSNGSQRMAQLISWTNSGFSWFSDNMVDTGGNAIGIHWIAVGTG